MLWKPKAPAIIHAPAEALDEYGNLRIGGGCPSHRRMLMAASGVSAGFRFFRVDITDNDGGSRVAITECDWVVSGVNHPTIAMDENDMTPDDPLVASASAEDGANLAWKAFANDGTTSMWQTPAATAGWLQIDLGAGNEILPDSVKIRAHASIPDRSPKDFTSRASNTGSFGGEETVLGTETGITGWTNGETKTFTF